MLRFSALFVCCNDFLRMFSWLKKKLRFHHLIYVPLPDEQTHLEIFQIRFRPKPINPYIEVERLVELTKSYLGVEIAAVCDEAGLIPLRDSSSY
jgi:SpoVK/Ycf46/Vps4 family AAA+-type ATPase